LALSQFHAKRTPFPEMAKNATVPPRLRLGLPLLCIAIGVLFILAHLLKGATTMVTGHAVVTDLNQEVSNDNLISAVHRLASADAWACVIIVAGLSGIWPYVKLLGTVMLVALVDCGRLTPMWSYNGLLVLEALGKYSYADVYMIVTNLIIFNISTGGAYTILGIGKLSLHMYMAMHFASLALIIAVSLSSMATHWAVFELSGVRSVRFVEKDDEEEAESKPLLEDVESSGASSTIVSQRGTLFQAPAGKHKWLSVCSGCFALASIALTIVGACVPYISVVRGGFLGKLIRPKEDQVLQISIFYTAQRLWAGDRMEQAFAVLGIIFSFVMPVLELAGIVVCTFGAFRFGIGSHWSRVGRLAADACHSLACVDVLLIVALVTVKEIHTVVEFNIGSTCAPFASFINDKNLLTVAGLGFAASDSCFDPRPAIQSGFWWLLVSVVLRTAAWRLVPSP